MENTQKSQQAAENVISQSEVLMGSTYPRWVEFVLAAKVSDADDEEALFSWISGGQGAPICPGFDDVTCDECNGAGGACEYCAGNGRVELCQREHYASTQAMVNGMSAFEWGLRCRLESMLAQLELGDIAGAIAQLRIELDGFEPLIETK
jgi:hypothetical protein